MGNDKLACSGHFIACLDFNVAWNATKGRVIEWNGPAMMAELTRHHEVFHNEDPNFLVLNLKESNNT